ncbi:Lipopolysaccharide core heptosyltransferase RfaQ [Pigmentiphaga humi]|uniref:Lipopolysaccharide core heptosyltransferase RfaQ n=1 Tax=Pigmentiphaga humi TaxID=2478468 RepID=A0A3P4B0Z6_9BURK|nr:glycosyltransferase family 9 protein [Pigmentiphaga humi]VCU69973.1 Lipopolysaccharide core heptosyltransferase RfaQ [Pigmentiphaga humi]
MQDARTHPLWQPEPRRIAVFRALQLGDLLCSLPALRTLRQRFPHARITLVGLAGAADFVRRFGRYIDTLAPFPGAPGMPEQAARPEELPAFYAWARSQRFDVALQMHGSGASTNAIVSQLGAARIAGFCPSPARDARTAGWWLPWPDELPEIRRYLALMRFLGIACTDAELEFPLADDDRRAAASLLAAEGLQPDRTVLVHPGARLASRRWPAARYAAVAASLARAGYDVALTGSDEERSLTRQVAALAETPVRDLAGRTSLGVLAALLEQVRLLVCNDTGVSHLAAAVGARSVVIASGSDVRRWAPLDRSRHVVLWRDVACRPCAYPSCPIGHPCALGVETTDVIRHAGHMLSTEPLHA